MKKIFIIITCLFLFSCDLFDSLFGNNGEKSTYNARIAWDSGLVSNSYGSHTVDGDSVFFYERPPGYNRPGYYALTRLNAETGAFIWRTSRLTDGIVFCQPVIIGGYVYVLCPANKIMCFDRETGIQTAYVNINIDNKTFFARWWAVAYQQYIYLSLWGNGDIDYFIRMDTGKINHGVNNKSIQDITPEIIWSINNLLVVKAKANIYDNIVFTATGASNSKPVQLAGFNIDSLEMVFHTAFGGPEDIADNIPYIEEGDRDNPIFIHDGVLYYLGCSIAAWDITSGTRLYRHVFTKDIPEPELYRADCLQPVYYKGKIYYTSLSSYEPNSTRNIHCINATTGKLVWNTIAIDSVSLRTNPIIAHDKLYISQWNGFYMYNPENGKLLGVDRSFSGADMGRHVLYKDYIICIRVDENHLNGRLVAVDVGK